MKIRRFWVQNREHKSPRILLKSVFNSRLKVQSEANFQIDLPTVDHPMSLSERRNHKRWTRTWRIGGSYDLLP
jgi:hypothetical protein